MPQYWEILRSFIFRGEDEDIKPENLRVVVENLKLLNEKAFLTDKELISEIHELRTKPDAKLPLGIILVSSHTTCRLCGGKLLIRHDRASNITVYTESFGTVIGTHYNKYCQNFRKNCSFKQYYGFSSTDIGGQLINSYDDNWEDHKYIVSTADTAFELTMLKKYDAELFLGQVSYSQKADIYNYSNGYPVPFKQCTTLDKEELPNRESTINKYVYLRMYTAIHYVITLYQSHNTCSHISVQAL